MAPKTPALSIEEIPGKTLPDLAAVQQRALVETASDLAATIRALLATGELVTRNGRIIPNPERIKT